MCLTQWLQFILDAEFGSQVNLPLSSIKGFIQPTNFQEWVGLGNWLRPPPSPSLAWRSNVHVWRSSDFLSSPPFFLLCSLFQTFFMEASLAPETFTLSIQFISVFSPCRTLWSPYFNHKFIIYVLCCLLTYLLCICLFLIDSLENIYLKLHIACMTLLEHRAIFYLRENTSWTWCKRSLSMLKNL